MANRRFIDFPIASTSGDTDIILIWQGGANKQTTKATFLSGLPENLDELNDVAISGLTNGQILRYDSVTGKWENTDQGNLDLNDLNDVSIVSPSNGQVLVYNSSTSKWENSSGGYVPYTGAVTTVNLGAQTIQSGQFVKAGGTAAQFLKADGSVDSNVYGTGTVTSVALTMPSAFNVANSPITTAGTLAVTGAGTVGQYIRGDGSLADFPESSGGGSSVSYYLNGSISQGTIGGVAYKELNKVPILGAGTDFTINADGYIASFLTDAGDPNLLEIAGGNWNFETYFSASSSGGTPTFYVELYKYDGTTFTLIASSSTSPELIAFGTNLNPYFSTLAVPTTTLALTDRLAVRFYVTHSGRTITLHTENNHLCQIITTFTTGLTSLNGLTAQVQNLAVGTSGTDFNIASATATHTFNLPTASATNRGALSSADWSTFNNKQNALTNPVTGTGTTNYLPKFTGASTIGNSNLINDASGNLGLGVTPSAWSILSPAIEIGTGGSFISAQGSTSAIYIGTNAFFNGSNWIYKSNGLASYSIQNGGEHQWFRAASGTAGNAISFTQAMTLFSDGNLLVGSPSPITNNGARLQVSGTSTFTGNLKINLNIAASAIDLINTSTNNIFTTYGNASNNTYIGLVNNNGVVQTNNDFEVFTGSSYTRRLIVNSSGNVGIGTASPSANSRLHVYRGGGSYDTIIADGDAGTNTGFAIYEGGSPRYALYSNGAGGNDSFNIYNFGAAANSLTITTSGNIGINVTPTSGNRFWVKGSSTSSGDSTILAQNSAGTNLFYVLNNGNVVMPNGNVLIGGTSNPYSEKVYIEGGSNLLTLSRPGAAKEYGFQISSGGNFILRDYTATSDRITLTSGANLLLGTSTDNGAKLQVNGDITTSAPAGGTAGKWKLGTFTSGAVATGGRIRIEINGVAYDILTT